MIAAKHAEGSRFRTVKINDIPEWIEREFTFPLARATVIDRAGTLEVDAPDRSDSETIGTLLERGGEEMYRSADELFEVVRGNLSDEYIGRKFYDDRGSNLPTGDGAAAEGRTDESF